MAYTFELNTSDSISLDDYIHHISERVDIEDIESVAGSAPELRKLANNRDFIVQAINRELAHWKQFQAGNSYTSQTIMLGGGDGFFVRANVWEPLEEDEEKVFREKLFSYELPHDHNFTFMTVGYSGSGYETEIYEYDRTQVGKRGPDEVEIRFLERTTLPVGKVMLYRMSEDIHSQHPPRELSISLNLMIRAKSPREQHYFDLGQGKISQVVHPGRGLAAVCRLAAHIGNQETASLLEQVGAVHENPYIRSIACESLMALEPGFSNSRLIRSQS